MPLTLERGPLWNEGLRMLPHRGLSLDLLRNAESAIPAIIDDVRVSLIPSIVRVFKVMKEQR